MIRITEVANNLFSATPNNVVLFGFFEEITISGYSDDAKDTLEVLVNGQFLDEDSITKQYTDGKVYFKVVINTFRFDFSSGYLVIVRGKKNKATFKVENAGPLPDNLNDEDLFNYLKNQIWYYHQMASEKSKRVYQIEHSMSWKVTKPLRLGLDLISFIPKIFTASGRKLIFGALKTQKGGALNNLGKGNTLNDVHAQYQHFLQRKAWEKLNLTETKKALNDLKLIPKISILIPTYNTPVPFLKACIDSVIAQTYENWELCIYDDASTNQETLDLLNSYAEDHQQIKVSFGKDNLHISLATNKASELATGEYIGLLDHDDALSSDALFEMVKYINQNPEIDFIYSDEDKVDENGLRVEPYFKSNFNKDLFLSNNYLNHFSVFRRSIFEKAGKFRKGFEGSQDYDLFLRIFSITNKFGHIPKVLYHWRKVPGSTAAEYSAKSYPEKASLKALNSYLQREDIIGKVEKGHFPGSFRVKRDDNSNEKVSIIIPFKDHVGLLKTCIEGILKTVEYDNLELVLVNNNSTEPKTLAYLEKLQEQKNVKILAYSKPFNYSDINNYAVQNCTGNYLLFLNNDIEPIEKGWFEAMLEHIKRSEVGAVGAKLLYPDHTIQHAGVILGLNGVASHGFKHLPRYTPGYFMRANVVQNLSACTAACLMVKREVFEKVDGFDSKNLKIAFNDIDLCLKIRSLGYLIVYTPYAELIHHESKSRGLDTTPEKFKRFESEVLFMQSKWNDELFQDPYYNPNLTLKKEDFSLKI